MTLDVITKTQAADSLLNAAVEMLLDRQDYISAIVLAGAAEDLLQGKLTRLGKGASAARPQMVPTVVAFAKKIGGTANEREAFGMLRATYNWLRHDDRTDPENWEVDLRVEAIVTVQRAMSNRYLIDGTDHPRAREVFDLPSP
jgi:hypothetical protein